MKKGQLKNDDEAKSKQLSKKYIEVWHRIFFFVKLDGRDLVNFGLESVACPSVKMVQGGTRVVAKLVVGGGINLH